MDDPAVLIVSQRDRADGLGRHPGYVSIGEGEDVLASCVDADVVTRPLDPSMVTVRARRLAGRAARRLTRSTRPFPSVSALRSRSAPSPPRPHYDVAVFVGLTIWDLALLEAIGDLRRMADRVIAWIPELWTSELTDPRLNHEPYAIADALFVGTKDPVAKLGTIVPCRVHFVPLAADVTRFAAVPLSARRPIDVLGIGRRDPDLHRALLDWSRKDNRLYVYDTISGMRVDDIDAHRQNLGDTCRRADIAITHYAKHDMPSVVGGQREMPGRLWEGLASGVLMAGFAPDEALQTELIGEPVVVELPPEPSAAIDIVDELHRGDHGDRRRHQVGLALRGHDWVHRWRDIFELSGVGVPPGLLQRIDRLEAMADGLDAGP